MQIVTRNLFFFSKIGFIGLGNMGFPMARNLAKKGHQVFAYDVDPTKEIQAKKHNITFRPKIKQLISDAKVFIAMLPNSQHSRAICESDDGLFKLGSPDTIVIDSSTISPHVAIDLNQKGKQNRITYVDAPVSGGVGGAEAGTLTFMVGAQNLSVFETVKPYLQCMGKNLFNCNKAGAGQIAKLCNNMALAIEMIGIAESIAMGKILGINQKILVDIMSVSSSRCWSVDTYNPVPGIQQNVPASRNYDRGFAVDLMLKDLKLATQAAKESNSRVQLGDLSKDIYQRLSTAGYGHKDFGIIYDILLNKKL